MKWILLFLLYIPYTVTLQDDVDLIEVNHVYDDKGQTTLDQVILWEYGYNKHSERMDFVVVTWCNLHKKQNRERLDRTERVKRQQAFNKEWVKKHGRFFPAPNVNPKFLWNVRCPRYDNKRKLWVIVTTEANVIRKIYSTSFKETWTQYDPELKNKDVFPIMERRRLQLNPNIHPIILKWKFLRG